MTMFKKGTKMTENHEEQQACCCECCHCKKIFMAMVIIILAFITGIMVGSCRQQYVIDMPYYANPHFVQHKMMKHPQSMQKQPSTNPTTQPSPASTDANAQFGGYIIEVEQAN